MRTRSTLTFGAIALLVAALAFGLAFQRGSVQAANLAQATQTALATETATDVATDVATDIGTDVVTDVATVTPTTTPIAPTPTDGTPLPPPADIPARTVTVTGMGEASAAPDEAFLSVGVQTDADTAGEALEQNNQQMEALMTGLMDAGVAADDIQTQFVSLYPRYADGPGQGSNAGIIGYTAVNTVEVHVRDLDTLGDLLDAAVAAGGNTINGIRFAVSEPNEVTSTARADAMDDARAKAQQLAELAGASLGQVLSITEGFAGGPIFAGGADLSAASVPIAPGTEALQVHVTVTWLLQ
jgi:uncharacterized protein YggE